MTIMNRIQNQAAVMLILAILIGGIVPAAEQEAAPPPPPPKWSGNINFAWTQSTGNTESMAASVSTAVTRKAPRTLFEASGHAYYGETDGDQTIDKGDALLRFSYFHTRRFFSYYEAGAYYDDFRRLDIGTRLAAGLGRVFIDTEKTKLNGRLGAAWTVEEYMEGTDDERYSSATIGFDFTRNLTETLVLTIKASSDRDFDNADNWTIDSEAALKSKLTERISLIISAADKYDNDPPPGVKENDFTLMTALGITF